MSKSAIDMIREERDRQISKEGWTLAHDDEHRNGELVCAAVVYASAYPIRAKSALSNEYIVDVWPDGWEYKPKDRISDLVRAGALIVAEIERLQRLGGNR